MNDPNVFANPCAICKVAEAERLCDYVVEYNRNPIFFRDYQSFKESVERGQDRACDLPLCTKCRVLINGADLCPFHFDMYKRAQQLPKNLRKYQKRARAQIGKETIEFHRKRGKRNDPKDERNDL